MSASWKPLLSLSVIVCSLLTLVAVPAKADPIPIRFSVRFAVAGDAASDPDFGSETAAGRFSIATLVPVGGGIIDFDTGLGADLVSFGFAGTSWSTTNADVISLGFNAQGVLTSWALSGFIGPDDDPWSIVSTFSPDILMAVSLEVPNLNFFDYTTPRSSELGIFSGRVLSWEATATPVPEPTSLLLLGTGLIGFAVRVRTRRLHGPHTIAPSAPWRREGRPPGAGG
jgi:hypothetical protein